MFVYALTLSNCLILFAVTKKRSSEIESFVYSSSSSICKNAAAKYDLNSPRIVPFHRFGSPVLWFLLCLTCTAFTKLQIVRFHSLLLTNYKLLWILFELLSYKLLDFIRCCSVTNCSILFAVAIRGTEQRAAINSLTAACFSHRRRVCSPPYDI